MDSVDHPTKMRELVDKYIRTKVRRLRPESVRQIESALGRLAEEWDATRRSPASLNQDWMEEFLAEVKEGGAGGKGYPITNNAYNNVVAIIRPFIKYLNNRNLVRDRYVLDACESLKPDSRRPYLRLTAAKVVQMIKACEDPWERLVLVVASQTLGRSSELRILRIRDLMVDRDEPVIAWYRTKTDDWDELFATSEMVKEWKRWAYAYQEVCGSLEKDWFVIPRRSGAPQTGFKYDPREMASGKSIGLVVQKHAARVMGEKQAALKGQAAHILRRSMARALFERLVEEGMDELLALDRVRLALGHDSVRTTMIYIGVEPGRRARNQLLSGSSLLWVPERDNVIQLRQLRTGEGS